MRVAGVQMRSVVGRREENLERAAALVQEAALRGAELVLLPELASSGYTVSPVIWAAAEPADGPTVQWLRRQGAEHGVHIGTSFVERDGRHIRNTFVLAGPDGSDVGRVRKTHAETYFFRGQRGSHVIDSSLGRIGVGICADNQYGDVARQFVAAGVDLLLMPHAGPVAAVVGGRVSAQDVRAQHDLLGELAPRYATMLGVPTLFVNQTGPMGGRRGTGLVGAAMEGGAFHLPGLTTIADADGTVLARLDGEEGVVVADVSPAERHQGRPHLGRSVFARPPSVRALMAVDGTLGRVYYAAHPRRRPPRAA